MATPDVPAPRFSPSEALILKSLAKGELPTPDWVATQRLKGWGLVEEKAGSLKLTQAGRDALRRLIARG
jgi:hypothetical protein